MPTGIYSILLRLAYLLCQLIHTFDEQVGYLQPLIIFCVYSKKETSTRRSELLAAVSPVLLKSVARVPHIWLARDSTLLLAGAILRFTDSGEGFCFYYRTRLV